MTLLDWAVIGGYLALIAGIGVYFARRASQSADDYLVAGRSLPWWVIGFSNVASSAGADAFWVLVFFSGAFVAFYRFFWIAAIVSVPLGILWARYWRRLRLVSAGALYEARYRGTAAGRYRGFFAIYGSLAGGALVLGYVFESFAQIMTPFLGWDGDTVLAVFCGLSVIYTMASGLFGVAYSDIPQFVLLMVGRVGLVIAVIAAAGGFDAVLDAVIAQKGADFLTLAPPADAEMFGKFKVEPFTLIALFLLGFFGIAGTRSITVQRSLAARSETDAALGQMMAAVLGMVVRVAPLALLGMAALALYPEGDAKEVWAKMVNGHAGPGLKGLILVGVVAGYMSTIDTYLNFMAANVYNDFWRRHLQPNASARAQLWVCRGITLALTGVAFLWAKVLIGEIDADWLNFINSVMGLFVLPLAMLRWVWWRMNIWGEIIGLLGGLPLAYVVWFTLGFKDEPYWMSFGVLFASGMVAVVIGALLTRPEPMDVLTEFYEAVRPPGFWGPVKARISQRDRDRNRSEWHADLASAAAGLVFCAGLTVGTGAAITARWGWLLGAAAALLVSGVLFMRAIRRADLYR